MFGAIKDENLSIDAHRSNNIRVLWLISSLVDLSGVIDLLFNGHLDRGLLAIRRISVATDLPSLLIIVVGTCCDILWQFNVGNLEIILCIVGGMGAYKQSMNSIILVRGPDRYLAFMPQFTMNSNLLLPVG